MKDTFSKKEYKCKCGRITADYVWHSQLAEHKTNCFKCGKELGFVQLVINKTGQSASIRTPTKNR